ncbi:MAG: hypothetical protein JWQ18_665 [Conexibacter sp.]|nr:hypothetical protein [Conexibacter sp.]
MCGLDVTHQALATAEVLDDLRAVGSPLAALVVDLLGFFAERYASLWGFAAPPVHDPVAVVDRFGVTGERPNAHVAMDLDHARFWALVVDAVRTLST